MGIYLSQQQFENLKKVSFKEGRNSSFKLFSYQDKECLIKIFCSKDELYQQEQTKLLLSAPPIQNSAYPIDTVQVQGGKAGYLCPYFFNTSSFNRLTTNSLPNYSFQIKRQAIEDTTRQLKMFHQNGFVLNDIRLSNHLLDKNGGHLVDFEDSGVVGQKKFPPAIFHFYTKQKENIPSITEDKRKQALCHISLLLNIHLESFVYELKQNAMEILPTLFEEKRELYEIVKEVVSSNEVCYFGTYLPTFLNLLPQERKQLEKKIKRKMRRKL